MKVKAPDTARSPVTGTNPGDRGGDGQLIGSCEWVCLKLLGGTTVETTPLVRHYVPAAVVTVHTGGCPWTEALAPLNAVSPAQGGARISGGLSVLGDGSAEMRGESLRPGAEFGFYEAEVFGSVSGALVAALPLEFVCPSATLPVPHYASAVDPLWRFGELEAAAALADVAAHQPSVRGLFEPPWPLPPGVEWGTLFPVTGWQDAGHDYRNAANVAQRAAFVATNRDFGLPGPLGANLHVRAALAGGGSRRRPACRTCPRCRTSRRRTSMSWSAPENTGSAGGARSGCRTAWSRTRRAAIPALPWPGSTGTKSRPCSVLRTRGPGWDVATGPY